jgi:integrase
MCLDIIQSLPRIAGSDFVFSVGRNAFASWGKSKSTLDSRLTIAPWTIHDLRRTHRTLVEKLHVPVHVVEAVLGHKLAGVRGIYNRFGYLDEKAEALLTLANLIQSIVDPTADTNVVPFRG